MLFAIDLAQFVAFTKANSLVIGQVIALIGIVGKLFGSFSKISFKKSKSITITILPKYLDEDLLCERHHNDLLFSNTGKLPISREDVVSPIRFLNEHANKINDVRITSSGPEWMMIKAELLSNSLIINFDLLNCKDYFVVRIYHNGFTNTEPMFRILGLSKITVRRSLIINKKLWSGITVLGVIFMVSPYDSYFKLLPQKLQPIIIAVVTFVLYGLATKLLNSIEIKKIRRYTRNGQLFQSKALFD